MSACSSIAEGLAIAAFRFMQHESKDALLKEMLEYVIKDESRHVGFGVLALRDGIKKLAVKERIELEDFCFTACDMMVTKVEDGVPRDGFLSGMSVFDEVGISIERFGRRNEAQSGMGRGGSGHGKEVQFVPVRGHDHPMLRHLD